MAQRWEISFAGQIFLFERRQLDLHSMRWMRTSMKELHIPQPPTIVRFLVFVKPLARVIHNSHNSYP